jgi:hypothetical protein
MALIMAADVSFSGPILVSCQPTLRAPSNWEVLQSGSSPNEPDGGWFSLASQIHRMHISLYRVSCSSSAEPENVGAMEMCGDAKHRGVGGLRLQPSDFNGPSHAKKGGCGEDGRQALDAIFRFNPHNFSTARNT